MKERQNRISMSVLGLFFLLTLVGQELVKAHKQYSLELGYRYMISNELLSDGGVHGYGFMLDYAWQLSGYTPAKTPVFLSFPLGYTFVPGSDGASQSMLSCGWTVRHILGKGDGIRPFVGYALLLNQYSERGREGSLFGHQTRFAVGMNHKSESVFTLFVKLEYSMARHPQFDQFESNWLHFMDLKAGIRWK